MSRLGLLLRVSLPMAGMDRLAHGVLAVSSDFTVSPQVRRCRDLPSISRNAKNLLRGAAETPGFEDHFTLDPAVHVFYYPLSKPSIEVVSLKESIQMLALRDCPRCHGDVRTNRDAYGEYRECLQCGYMTDIEVRQRPGLTPSETPIPSRSGPHAVRNY